MEWDDYFAIFAFTLIFLMKNATKMLETCITCTTSENLLLLGEQEWKVLDYVLYPHSNKSHLEDLKANCTIKVCSKCQDSMQTINKFRTMALTNYLALFKTWEEQNSSAAPRIEEIKIKQEFIDTDAPKTGHVEVHVENVKTEPYNYSDHTGDEDDDDDDDDEDDDDMERNSPTQHMLNNVLQSMYVPKTPEPGKLQVELVPEPFGEQTATSGIQVGKKSKRIKNPENIIHPSKIPHEQIPQLLKNLLPRAYKKGLGIPNDTDVMDMLEKEKVSDDSKRDSSLEIILLTKLDELKNDLTNVPGIRSTLTNLPLECPLCRRKLISLSNLKKHLKSGHQQLNHCASCNKWFDDQQSLRNHIKNSKLHAIKEQLRCDFCGEKFMYKTPLREHIDFVHLKTHRCEKCDKVFRTMRDLQRHKDAVHDKKRPPKDKICSYCGRGFTLARYLTAHVRTHTGERPLNCSHCPATFAHPAALYTHNKLKHKNEPKKSTSHKKRKNE